MERLILAYRRQKPDCCDDCSDFCIFQVFHLAGRMSFLTGGSTPVKSGEVGVGCALGQSEAGEVVVKGLAHGGPCHLCCQVAIGDVVVSVDGSLINGDVRLAKGLFLGEDGTGVTLTLRRNGIARNVHLLRGKPIEHRPVKEGELCGIGVTNSVRGGLAICRPWT